MKTSININLFGTVYAIDEDAHKLLDQYLTSMKQYFSRQEGGDEIADDIEHRVAELFWDLKQQGTESISIEQVKEIMHKIGNPEEMSDADQQSSPNAGNDQQLDANDLKQNSSDQQQQSNFSNSTNSATEASRGPRHFYRDGRDKVLGGVLSGACRYFGWEDPLLLRIVFVLLALFTDGLLVFIYLLLWAIAPKAVTAEQRLKMQGKTVNPDTLRSEVIDSQTPVAKSDHSGCFKVLLGMVLAPFGCLGGLLICIFIFVAFILLMTFVGLSSSVLSGGNLELGNLLMEQRGTLILALVCLVAVIALPIWGLWRWFRRDTHHTSSLTSIILFCLWLLALVVGLQQYNHLKDKFSNIEWKNIELDIDDDWTDDIDITTDSDSLPYIDRSEDYALDFTAIEFNGVGKLVFRQDSAYSVKMKGNEWFIKHTLTSCENGKLKIELDDQASRRGNNPGVTIEVSAPCLTDLKVAGVGTCQIDGGLKQELPFSLQMEGVGKVRSWDKIECPKVTLTQRGVGSTKVNVDTDSLLVTCEGVGQVFISGQTRSYQRNASDFLSKIEDADLHIGQ